MDIAQTAGLGITHQTTVDVNWNLYRQIVGTAEDRDVLHEPGRLMVEVIEARNLCDRAFEPYCIAAYEHNQQLMPVSKGRNPVWKSTVTLYVHDEPYQYRVYSSMRKCQCKNSSECMASTLTQ